MNNLTKIYLLCLIVLIALPQAKASESEDGIQFTHGSWSDAVAKAKKENKLLFVDCYTTWCGPCKMLSKKVFPQKEVGDYFNANYINVKLDCEKGEGPGLKKKFGVSAFPTMLFIDPSNEKVLHRVVGFRPAEELLKEAKAAPEEAKKAEALAMAFKKNKKNRKATEDYLNYLMKVGDPKCQELAIHYLNLIPTSEWVIKENFRVMQRYVKDPFGKHAQYFFANKELFEKENGRMAEYFESGLYYGYLGNLARVENKKDFNQKKCDKLIALAESNKFDRVEGLKDFTNRTLLVSVKDWDGYMQVVEQKFKEGLEKNEKYYAQSGYGLLNRLNDCDDKAIFLRASKLMDDVIAQQLALDHLNINTMSFAYRDSYKYLKQAGITDKRLDVAQAMDELFKNLVPKINKELDKAYDDGQKAKKEGQTGSRPIPMMQMGGM
jgi:thioredoxin-related protein